MIQWIANAFSTYFLHSMHGNGYQWWSGPGSNWGLLSIFLALVLKHNCYEHRCWRIGRVIGEDGHHRCKRHHKETHPEYATR